MKVRMNSPYGDYRPLDLPLLKGAKVVQYDSLRKDAPWWECGLEHPAVLEYRRLCRLAKRICPENLVYDNGVIRHDWDAPPAPTWSGVEYRRLSAQGCAV